MTKESDAILFLYYQKQTVKNTCKYIILMPVLQFHGPEQFSFQFFNQTPMVAKFWHSGLR